jgi:hypothetical protein
MSCAACPSGSRRRDRRRRPAGGRQARHRPDRRRARWRAEARCTSRGCRTGWSTPRRGRGCCSRRSAATNAPTRRRRRRRGAEPLGEALGPASPFDPSVVVDVPDQIGPAAGTCLFHRPLRRLDDRPPRRRRLQAGGHRRSVPAPASPSGSISTRTRRRRCCSPRAARRPCRWRSACRCGAASAPSIPASRRASRARRRRACLAARTWSCAATARAPSRSWCGPRPAAPRACRARWGGLSGAPALDDQAAVLGVTIAERPRSWGAHLTTAPEIVFRHAHRQGRRPTPARGRGDHPLNYFYVGRRPATANCRCQVVCLGQP